MKRDRKEAARILLANGWDFEEVEEVLRGKIPNLPQTLPPIRADPYAWPKRPWWGEVRYEAKPEEGRAIKGGGW